MKPVNGYTCLIVILLFVVESGFAGNTSDTLKLKPWKENHYVDMSLSLGQKIFTSSVAWHKMFNIAWKKRVHLGAGLRFNMANVIDRTFVTAFPARPVAGSYDSLFLDDHTIYSMNLTFNADISFTRWFDVGMNIDVVGLSWGETSDALYHSATFNPAVSIEQARPELLNVFLFGRNDRGSLNSQFYFRFWPGENFFVKAGFSIYHIIENTSHLLNYSNNRFFTDAHMGFLSLGWTPLRTAWLSSISQ